MGRHGEQQGRAMSSAREAGAGVGEVNGAIAVPELVLAMTDAVLLVRDGVVTGSRWGRAGGTPPAGSGVGLPVAELVHPDDSLALPPERPALLRLRDGVGGYRWYEAAGEAAAGGGCWLALRDVHSRVEREHEAQRSLDRLSQAVDASLDGMAVYAATRDAAGTVTHLALDMINATGARGFAGDPSGLVGRDLAEFWPESRRNGLWDALVQALDTGEPVRAVIEGDGESWTGVTEGVQVPLDADTVLSSWRDVTEHMRHQKLLARAYEETAQARTALQAALDATSDSFAVYALLRDATGAVERIVIRLLNPAAAGPLGFPPDELVGRDLLEVFPQLRACGLWDAIVASVEEGLPRQHRVHEVDDLGRWQASFDNTVAPVGDDQVVVTWRDVTREEQGRRHLEQTRSQAEHAATHDHLTGLPNRALLEQRLQDALDNALRERLVAVVFCDLDDFKAVNDTYGHPAGDIVLRAVAQRLHLLTRNGETASRLAGDEFVLLLRDLPPNWNPHDFVERAQAELHRPVDIGPAVVAPSVSLGLVLVDPRREAGTPQSLLEQADRAMYEVKRRRGRPERGAAPVARP
jgi:diguanylate cyclase (GGDEF)-like protein